jgi:hypothetical protein
MRPVLEEDLEEADGEPAFLYRFVFLCSKVAFAKWQMTVRIPVMS